MQSYKACSEGSLRYLHMKSFCQKSGATTKCLKFFNCESPYDYYASLCMHKATCVEVSPVICEGIG